MTTEQQEESLTGAQGKRPLLLQMAENMARSVEALGPALAAVDVAVSPQLAAVMQETENTWREMDAEFGLLTSNEVSAAVGSKSPNRSWASEQRSAGRLLAINRPRGTHGRSTGWIAGTKSSTPRSRVSTFSGEVAPPQPFEAQALVLQEGTKLWRVFSNTRLAAEFNPGFGSRTRFAFFGKPRCAGSLCRRHP
ncbi:hypothetical protein [Paenarthrobacter sp. PH39-S1]|uniref:hypothetical protein n=1 Tax=Paenarthrobacter sp. PH39-S1 TaxID=3046204 RepID=UPI0024BB78C1|nr:hypothetical protein [Paenarthrobacter sp. PH39-S1]MDJ0356247.1 hypothetical protein [Paenarthrobacter sp. PH39-S1]